MKVRIDDGYCAWEFPLNLPSDNYSINDIHQAICKELAIKPSKDGKLVRAFGEAE